MMLAFFELKFDFNFGMVGQRDLERFGRGPLPLKNAKFLWALKRWKFGRVYCATPVTSGVLLHESRGRCYNLFCNQYMVQVCNNSGNSAAQFTNGFK